MLVKYKESFLMTVGIIIYLRHPGKGRDESFAGRAAGRKVPVIAGVTGFVGKVTAFKVESFGRTVVCIG